MTAAFLPVLRERRRASARDPDFVFLLRLLFPRRAEQRRVIDCLPSPGFWGIWTYWKVWRWRWGEGLGRGGAQRVTRGGRGDGFTPTSEIKLLSEMGRGLGVGGRSRINGGVFGALAREDQSSAKRSHALHQRGELRLPRRRFAVILGDSLQSAAITALIHFYRFCRGAATGGADVT